MREPAGGTGVLIPDGAFGLGDGGVGGSPGGEPLAFALGTLTSREPEPVPLSTPNCSGGCRESEPNDSEPAPEAEDGRGLAFCNGTVARAAGLLDLSPESGGVKGSSSDDQSTTVSPRSGV